MPALLASNQVAELIVPRHGEPLTSRVNPTAFERWDGFEPLDNAPNAYDPTAGRGSGFDYYQGRPGGYPRPGQLDQPHGQTYTRSSWGGLVNTLGGQPLPIGPGQWLFRPPTMGFTGGSPDYRVAQQNRMGVSQRGPSALGAENTNALANLNANPPNPEDLTNIIGGVY